MAAIDTAAEENLVKATDLKRVREVDFVNQFTHNRLDKLIEVLGVTRKIPVEDGTTMYVYSIDGTVDEGNVPEGEVIPLSHFEQTKTPIDEITLNKWRKGVTAEAIRKSGLNEALIETDMALLRKIQTGIRTDLFTFLNGSIPSSETAEGKYLQDALANAWGKLQVKFEDDAAEAVYFVNPEDVATYLGAAAVPTVTPTVFGMNYLENFLGLGTVIMSSQITKGTFLATAKENILMYYIPTTGDLATAFDLVTDETGYVGIKSGYQNEERAQLESLVMSGVRFAVEYAAGVVKGTITPE